MAAAIEERTPWEEGFRAPAEWEPHQACLMAWPTRTRLPMWGELFEEAERDYAAVASAIVDFEPVVMVVDPDQERRARRMLPSAVELLPLPIDDSWMRDNGPIFVRDDRGRLALVHFRFNAWGEKFHPYERDADVPRLLAEHFGVRRYVAPFVLEGGSVLVDGEGTLLTTEQCLLHPNRNPDLSRGRLEELLRAYLGAETVIWLGRGHSADRDTDGHIDGIAQYAAPGVVLLLAPADPTDPDHASGADNLRRLRDARDAAGRRFEVVAVDPGAPSRIPYLNCYLPNGAVIVPVGGGPEEEAVVARIRAAFPGREVVRVPGRTLMAGGGGPHCITQQVPEGRFVA
ncbi:MAG TPA: agmatine deiminase family protein [Actinomycetota bacterium]|nr:agmatine deiminase family protein [Actinomycetota bacterium]